MFSFHLQNCPSIHRTSSNRRIPTPGPQRQAATKARQSDSTLQDLIGHVAPGLDLGQL